MTGEIEINKGSIIIKPRRNSARRNDARYYRKWVRTLGKRGFGNDAQNKLTVDGKNLSTNELKQYLNKLINAQSRKNKVYDRKVKN